MANNLSYGYHEQERQNARISQDFKKHNWLMEKFKSRNILTEKEQKALETLSEMHQLQINPVTKKQKTEKENNLQHDVSSGPLEPKLDMPEIEANPRVQTQSTKANSNDDQVEVIMIELDPVEENITSLIIDTPEAENNHNIVEKIPPVARQSPLTEPKQNVDTVGSRDELLKDYFVNNEQLVSKKHKLPVSVSPALTPDRYRKLSQSNSRAGEHLPQDKDNTFRNQTPQKGAKHLKTAFSPEDQECIKFIRDKGLTLDQLKQIIIDSDEVMYVNEIRPSKDQALSDESVANLVAHSSEQKEAFDIMRRNAICNRIMVDYFKNKNELKESKKKVCDLSNVIALYKLKYGHIDKEKEQMRNVAQPAPQPPPAAAAPPPAARVPPAPRPVPLAPPALPVPSVPPPPPVVVPVSLPPPVLSLPPVPPTSTALLPNLMEDEYPKKPVRQYSRRSSSQAEMQGVPPGAEEPTKRTYGRGLRGRGGQDRSNSLAGLQGHHNYRAVHAAGFYRPNPNIFSQTDDLTSGSFASSNDSEPSYHQRYGIRNSSTDSGQDCNQSQDQNIPSSFSQHSYRGVPTYGQCGVSARNRQHQPFDSNHNYQSSRYLMANQNYGGSYPLNSIGQNHLNIPNSTLGHFERPFTSHNNMSSLEAFSQGPRGHHAQNVPLAANVPIVSSAPIGANTTNHSSNSHMNDPYGRSGSFGTNTQAGHFGLFGQNSQVVPNGQPVPNVSMYGGHGSHVNVQGQNMGQGTIGGQMGQRWVPATTTESGQQSTSQQPQSERKPVSPPYANTMPEHLWNARTWPQDK